MEDSAHVHALLQIVCTVQMLLSARDHIWNESAGEAGREGN